jgi:hypothetical protein
MANIQWKVVSEDLTDTYDNLPACKRAYGKIKADINDNESGWVQMFGREDYKDKWQMLQEFRLNMEDEDDEE